MNPEFLKQSNEVEESITRDAEESADLVIARKAALDANQAEAMHNLKEMALRAGRIQASKLIASFSDCLTVGQLRELKDHAQRAGVTFAEACQLVGISRQTAYRYLKAADDLGDDFVSHVRQMGVTIRALESARQLPADVRKRLTTGEVINLEEVTKEELTEVIKDLVIEHSQAMTIKAEAITEEQKATKKAEDKARRLEERVGALDKEMANLKAGLPADDAEAMQIIRGAESKIVPLLVMYRHTKMTGRSPEAVGRIVASLELVREMAEWTGNHLAAKATGEEPDDDTLGAGARMVADEIAAHDGQPPVSF